MLLAVCLGDDLREHIFTINACGVQYQMVLPNHQSDYIQNKLSKTATPYEYELLELMHANLKPGDLVLDIGANIGNHTVFLAKVTKCNVMAFEPNMMLCNAHQETINLNGLESKIELYDLGVGECSGKAHFKQLIPENIGSQSLVVDETLESTIEIVSLDSLNIAEKVRAIKIDVEGMELAVLKGGRKLITRDKPLLFVEAQTSLALNNLRPFLLELGYVLWDTFNATPTHWFIHKTELSLDSIAAHSFEIAEKNYRFIEQLRSQQEKLELANKKYSEANERIDVLKNALDVSHHKIRNDNSQPALFASDFKFEVTSCVTNHEKPLSYEECSTIFPKELGNFDFSISNEQAG